MKISNNKLIAESTSELVENTTTVNQGGTIEPRYIVLHFTAGRSAESSIAWFKNPTAKASAHLVIAKDGTITQLVDFNRKAWHAGKSKWANLNGFNELSIGIELDNPGKLSKVGDKYYSWFKKEYSKENIVEAIHKHDHTASYWYEYTEEQIEACLNVCKLLMENIISKTFWVTMILLHFAKTILDHYSQWKALELRYWVERMMLPIYMK